MLIGVVVKSLLLMCLYKMQTTVMDYWLSYLRMTDLHIIMYGLKPIHFNST